MFHNKVPVLFPLTRMDLDSNPPRFSSSSVKNMTMKIKKGSKPFRKVLEKTYDFLTGDRLDRWRRASKNNNISEENLRKAFKMISCKYFNAKQKDKILKFLCKKTIYNNQVENAFADPEQYPEWFVSKYCNNCRKDDILVEEDMYHANFSCPTILAFQRAAFSLFGFEHQPDPNPTTGPRIHLAPTNLVAALCAANLQTNLSTYIIQWMILMVGSQFRTQDSFSSDDGLKMLAKDLKVMLNSSADPVLLSIRVNYEALSGHLTRPPEPVD